MNFEWDEAKNRANIRKHGLGFEEAWKIFQGPFLQYPDLRTNYGEDRWIVIGLLGNRIAVLTFTLRGSQTLRIISLRRATRDERKKFEEEFGN